MARAASSVLRDAAENAFVSVGRWCNDAIALALLRDAEHAHALAVAAQQTLGSADDDVAIRIACSRRARVLRKRITGAEVRS